jgi:hypothetical protein
MHARGCERKNHVFMWIMCSWMCKSTWFFLWASDSFFQRMILSFLSCTYFTRTMCSCWRCEHAWSEQSVCIHAKGEIMTVWYREIGLHTCSARTHHEAPYIIQVLIYIYIYTCMYVCIYVCIYVCMYVCMYACIYTCIQAHMYHTHTSTYIIYLRAYKHKKTPCTDLKTDRQTQRQTDT